MSSKINLNRIEMPKQAPDVRKYNFREVALGYSHDQAMAKAKDAYCVRSLNAWKDVL